MSLFILLVCCTSIVNSSLKKSSDYIFLGKLKVGLFDSLFVLYDTYTGVPFCLSVFLGR